MKGAHDSMGKAYCAKHTNFKNGVLETSTGDGRLSLPTGFGSIVAISNKCLFETADLLPGPVQPRDNTLAKAHCVTT